MAQERASDEQCTRTVDTEKHFFWLGLPLHFTNLDHTTRTEWRSTYVAQFVEITKEVLRLGEHQEPFHLHFLQWFHETLPHVSQVVHPQVKTNVYKTAVTIKIGL